MALDISTMHGSLPRPRKLFRRTGHLRPRTVRAAAFAFVALVILSFVGAEGWSVWQARQDRLDSARVTTINMTRALAQHANDTIQAADIALVGVVEALENDGMDAAAKPNLKTLLQRTVVRFPALNSVSIYDSQGRGLATSRNIITGKFAIPDREYFRYHVTNRDSTAHVGGPVRSVYWPELLASIFGAWSSGSYWN